MKDNKYKNRPRSFTPKPITKKSEQRLAAAAVNHTQQYRNDTVVRARLQKAEAMA